MEHVRSGFDAIDLGASAVSGPFGVCAGRILSDSGTLDRWHTGDLPFGGRNISIILDQVATPSTDRDVLLRLAVHLNNVTVVETLLSTITGLTVVGSFKVTCRAVQYAIMLGLYSDLSVPHRRRYLHSNQVGTCIEPMGCAFQGAKNQRCTIGTAGGSTASTLTIITLTKSA